MSCIEEHVGFILAQVCKAHRNTAETLLNTIGLHAGQEMILLRLWREEGLAQSQLVEQLCVEPPTITKMLQRMEREGLIERRSDPSDARVSRVYLTERGRALEAQVSERWAELEQRTMAGMTAEERMLLRRLLLQVQHNLS